MLGNLWYVNWPLYNIMLSCVLLFIRGCFVGLLSDGIDSPCVTVLTTLFGLCGHTGNRRCQGSLSLAVMLFLFATSLYMMYLAESDGVTLPFHDEYGHIVLVFDGQPISLLADSGSARFFVVYGEWFERQYGRGSCRRHNMTCYFCPVEAPCGDIEHRERFGVRYAEGQDVYQYVQHSGVLDLGQSAIQITFGLLVNYTTKIGFAPHSTLGLSFGRADIPKTFLQQLKDANVIDVLSYSVRYSQVSQYATGNLVVGGSAAEAQGTAHLPLKLIPGARRGIHVSIVSMTIAHAGASPAGGDSGRPTPISLDGSLALFDTGTCCIAVPYLVIAALVRYVRERIEADPRVETVLFRKDSLSSYMVRSHHVRFLPAIVYSLVGEGGKIVDVKIFPEHYVGWCNVIWCEVHIYAHSNGGEIVVGEPFFRAYDAHIDLENNTTAITAHPLRPSWEKALQVAKQPRRMKICDI